MSLERDTEGEQPKSIRPPTPLARKLVRYIVGFGVGTSLGLAPYLGLVNVPRFRALLTLIPDSIQDTVIPLSAALMGTVAVVIQWYSGEQVSRLWLRKLFARTLITAILTFILFTIIHAKVVVTLPVENDQYLSSIVGFGQPNKPPCTGEVSKERCLMLVTQDPADIAAFWGDTQILLAKLSLIFSYLLFTGSFGMLVGLIVLKGGMQDRAREG